MFLKAFLAWIILYVPNQLRFPSDLGLKGLNVFNLLLLVGLVMMLVSEKSDDDRPAPLRGRIFFYFLVICIAFVLGTAQSPDYLVDDITHLKTILTYPLLYFIYYRCVRDRATARLLLAVVMGTAFIAGVEAFRQALDYGLGSGKRVAGPFGYALASANYAGVFFAIFAPMGLSLVLFHRERLIRLAGASVYASALIGVFYTYSRTALAAIGVTTVLLSLIRSRVLAFAVVFLIINFAVWGPETVLQRVESTTVETAQGEEKLEESTESRFYLWEGGWEMLKERPYGIGLNQFHRQIEPHLPPWIIARDAHNHFVLIATEAGIQGFIALVLLCLGFYSVGFQLLRQREDREARALGWGYVMCVTGLIMGNLYNSLIYSGEVMGNFWILTALMARYRDFAEREQLEAKRQVERAELDGVDALV
ncbi:MAG: hypothetical protein AMJ72_12645 [Acidithiobacillales bacterium SM1_46]|jgi:O-antigen ligase|nr:MAG: hypothetical protein AMJ72_12645 [Acidithiobacillales bacterium SM1_46]